MSLGPERFTMGKTHTRFSVPKSRPWSNMSSFLRRHTAVRGAAILIAMGVLAEPVGAQWSQVYEQRYLPAEHNWVFRRSYPIADRLFNAFDYGHAILYETLLTKPGSAVSELEEEQFDFLTQKLLKRPPRIPLEESAIEIEYAKLVPEVKMMFDWAHLLHRQLYDILADERLSQAEKDAAVAEILAYYKTRPDLAFSSHPKGMDLMDGQFYSLAFREKYPKFNGLIWAYHWLQVGLYEPLMVNSDAASRARGIEATVGRFWQMLSDAPATMPYLMPMTVAIAPTFSERYPEAAIIFDNLHMMHDVVSDILASPEVPRGRKRDQILAAAAQFRDDTSHVIAFAEWRSMGGMMGANNMGGPAVGFPAALPQPTVPRGQSMAGMNHGTMGGAQAGSMAGMDHTNMPGMQGGNAPAPAQAGQMPGMDHSGMPAMTNPGQGGPAMEQMMAMHQRMMQDPVIRERVATDPVLQRMMQDMESMMAQEQTMPGMNMNEAAAMTPAQREAQDFIVRLLSDPEVEARVHSDPDLHRLWVDPEVQRRLAELRRQRQRGAAPTPPTPPARPAAPATPQGHEH